MASLTPEDVELLLKALITCCFEHPEATNVQRRNILENGLMGFIFHELHNGSPAESVLKYMEKLPIYADTEEMERISELFVSLIETNHVWTTDSKLRTIMNAQFKKTL